MEQQQQKNAEDLDMTNESEAANTTDKFLFNASYDSQDSEVEASTVKKKFRSESSTKYYDFRSVQLDEDLNVSKDKNASLGSQASDPPTTDSIWNGLTYESAILLNRPLPDLRIASAPVSSSVTVAANYLLNFKRGGDATESFVKPSFNSYPQCFLEQMRRRKIRSNPRDWQVLYSNISKDECMQILKDHRWKEPITNAPKGTGCRVSQCAVHAGCSHLLKMRVTSPDDLTRYTIEECGVHSIYPPDGTTTGNMMMPEFTNAYQNAPVSSTSAQASPRTHRLDFYEDISKLVGKAPAPLKAAFQLSIKDCRGYIDKRYRVSVNQLHKAENAYGSSRQEVTKSNKFLFFPATSVPLYDFTSGYSSAV